MTWTLSRACPEDWEEMKHLPGDRICSRCTHRVVDGTQLTEREFSRVMQTGDHCARLRVGPDGTPIFRPEPRLRFGRSLVILGALSVGCQGEEPATEVASPLHAPLEAAEEPAPSTRSEMAEPMAPPSAAEGSAASIDGVGDEVADLAERAAAENADENMAAEDADENSADGDMDDVEPRVRRPRERTVIEGLWDKK